MPSSPRRPEPLTLFTVIALLLVGALSARAETVIATKLSAADADSYLSFQIDNAPSSALVYVANWAGWKTVLSTAARDDAGWGVQGLADEDLPDPNPVPEPELLDLFVRVKGLGFDMIVAVQPASGSPYALVYFAETLYLLNATESGVLIQALEDALD